MASPLGIVLIALTLGLVGKVTGRSFFKSSLVAALVFFVGVFVVTRGQSTVPPLLALAGCALLAVFLTLVIVRKSAVFGIGEASAKPQSQSGLPRSKPQPRPINQQFIIDSERASEPGGDKTPQKNPDVDVIRARLDE